MVQCADFGLRDQPSRHGADHPLHRPDRGQYDPGPFWFGNGDREPGDYGWAKYAKLEGPALLRKQKAEIKNGRLAMIAVMGFVSAHYLPGSVPFLNNLGF